MRFYIWLVGFYENTLANAWVYKRNNDVKGNMIRLHGQDAI